MPPMTAAQRESETIALKRDLADVFGARYFAPGASAVIEARPTNLYHYTAFIGIHDVAVEAGDCVYYVGDDTRSAWLVRGPAQVSSRHLATVIRGYMPESKSTTIHQGTGLRNPTESQPRPRLRNSHHATRNPPMGRRIAGA